MTSTEARYYENKKKLFDFYAQYKRKPYYHDTSSEDEVVLFRWILNMINRKKSIFVKDFFKKLKDDFKNKFGITFDDMWKSKKLIKCKNFDFNKKQLFDFYSEHRRQPYQSGHTYNEEPHLHRWVKRIKNLDRSKYLKDYFNELQVEFEKTFGVNIELMFEAKPAAIRLKKRYNRNKKKLFDFYQKHDRRPCHIDGKTNRSLYDWINSMEKSSEKSTKQYLKNLKVEFKNKFGINFDDMWKSSHEKYIKSKQVVREENSAATVSATKKKSGRPKKKLIADDMQSVETETMPLPDERATAKSNQVGLEAKQYRELKAREREYNYNYRKTARGREKRRLAQQRWKRKKKAEESEHHFEENCNKHIHCEEDNNDPYIYCCDVEGCSYKSQYESGLNRHKNSCTTEAVKLHKLTMEKINKITTVDVGIQTDNNDVCVKPKPKHKHDFQFSIDTGYAICRECSHFIKLN